MKILKLACLWTVLAAVASAPLFAAPKCGTGFKPRLSGDLFSPVDCSSTTLPVAFLPLLPVASAGKTNLRDLDGRWEGILIHGIGRYNILLTVKTAWSGKTELTLDTKEMQFHDRLTDRITLTPVKGRGAYEAVLATTLAPDISLNGNVLIGSSVPPEASTTTAKAPPPDRQADVTFANGAVHRVIYALEKDELRVRAFSGVPGAPLQKFELVLTRTKRETL